LALHPDFPRSPYPPLIPAVETVVWLHDVRKAHDKFEIMRFDASGAVSAGMFAEDWPRYGLKMATGAGKTKVLSLLIAWSSFHRTYEKDPALSRNFLVIDQYVPYDAEYLKSHYKTCYIFENEWQSFRTRKDRELELTSARHIYGKARRYVVAVKVIDIFSNDTMTLVPLTIG
jgi:hypothetical protein